MFWFPAGSRLAARGARICEKGLLQKHWKRPMEDIGFEGEYTFWCDILKTINTLFEDDITMQEYI